jgi:hypothetical protein
MSVSIAKIFHILAPSASFDVLIIVATKNIGLIARSIEEKASYPHVTCTSTF